MEVFRKLTLLKEIVKEKLEDAECDSDKKNVGEWKNLQLVLIGTNAAT